MKGYGFIKVWGMVGRGFCYKLSNSSYKIMVVGGLHLLLGATHLLTRYGNRDYIIRPLRCTPLMNTALKL
jgi:hypothetical protein